MKPDSTLHNRWPVLLAILTAVVGICLSLYFRSRIAQTEATTAQLTAETLRLNTEQELELFVEVLESVRALHTLSDAVDQAAMNEFIEKGLIHQHDILGAFGLAQRINPHVRTLLETEAKEQGTGYRVVQAGTNGTWATVGPKSAYYPLTWQTRTKALNIPTGFDFSSSKEASQTIKQIEKTHQTALVPAAVPQRMKDRGQKSEIVSPRYWVFSPVTPRNAPNAVIGFAVAILHPKAILRRVAERSSLSPELRLHVASAADVDSGEAIRLVNGAWVYSHPLKSMGTQWIFECDIPATGAGHRSVIALLIGLIITALLTSQLLLLGNRTRKIEAEVLTRTEDLRIANLQLEENLHERARMEEEMNELTARERRRIGRDLHDSLGQKLTGAVFLSRSLLNYFENKGKSKADLSDDALAKSEKQKPEDRRQRTENLPSNPATSNQQPATQETHAKTLNETLKSSVSQVRNMARGLAPIALEAESLCEALQQLAEEMTALYGVSCETAECSAPPELEQKAKEQLYLIAREAVNNAARHAQASHITLLLTDGPSGWQLLIKDNGKGLSRSEPSEKGMGIRIMRHRAHLIGAEFAITSAPDQGTRITVESQAPEAKHQSS